VALSDLWQRLEHAYSRVNTFLEQFYRLGPAAHGAQGVVREFLDGPPEGVQLTWAQDLQGLICDARDRRGSYRIELHRKDGHWVADGCSCLGFLEFRRECRHLRAVREDLASRGGDDAG